jgi:heme exporter protein A
VGLTRVNHQPCHTLSAGQRRRVAWARLLLRRSLIWLLDEPFTAIDAKGVEVLNNILQQHVQADKMVILTSHQPVSVAGIKTHVIAL